MEIPLDLARTLAVVIDEGTFDAAARRLRITPSAVCQRVKALEQQLGRVLVVRSKPARATEAGEAIVRLARQLALLEHDALADVRARRGRRAPSRSPLAVNADSLATWFLPALARLSRSGIRSSSTCTATTRTSRPGCSSRARCMAAVTSQARRSPDASCDRSASCATRPSRRPRFADRWWLAGDRGADAAALARAPSSTSTAATTCSATACAPAAWTPTARRGTTCRRRTTSPPRSSSGSAGGCCRRSSRRRARATGAS